MNILYGVAGEGSGHSSRAKEVIEHLQSRGHSVKVVSYDRGYTNLAPLFDTERIFGLRLIYKNNHVQNVETVFHNLLHTPQVLTSIEHLFHIIKTFQPSVILTDFEPLSAYCANSKGIPLISIDNQHRITNTSIDYPKRYERDAFIAKAVIRAMVSGTDACLVTNFFDHPITNPKTYIFPPILRKEILETTPTRGEHILVYSTAHNAALPKLLEKVNIPCIAYGFGKTETVGNITYKETSPSEFIQDLAHCRAVIGTAGFTLITEALHLGKPYLALPITGQFEQLLNAYYVQQLGYGEYNEHLDAAGLNHFLEQCEVYAENLQNYKREDNTLLFTMLDQLLSIYE